MYNNIQGREPSNPSNINIKSKTSEEPSKIDSDDIVKPKNFKVR